MRSPGAVNYVLALDNLRKLNEKITIMRKWFQNHKNFVSWCPGDNFWYNNPEKDEVPAGKFKQLCDLHLGDISFRKFLTELRWEDYREKLERFIGMVVAHYSDISWYDVYWAEWKMHVLFMWMYNMRPTVTAKSGNGCGCGYYQPAK